MSELYGCAPDDCVADVQARCARAVGRRAVRADRDRDRVRGSRPSPPTRTSHSTTAKTPDELTRYWTTEQISAARTLLAPFLYEQAPEKDPGAAPPLFPHRVRVEVVSLHGHKDTKSASQRHDIHIPVGDIVCLAVRTVWELLLRPAHPPQLVRALAEEMPAGWARECLCESAPSLGDRLRGDWRAVLGPWARAGSVRVPRGAEELEGVLSVATQFVCWRDQYIARWFALAPLLALTPKARRRVQTSDLAQRQCEMDAEYARQYSVDEPHDPEAKILPDRSPAFGWLRGPVVDRCLLHIHRALGADGAEGWEMGRTYVYTKAHVAVRVPADVISERGVFAFRPLRPDADPTLAAVHLAFLALARGDDRISYRALDPVSGRCLVLRVPAHRRLADLEGLVDILANLNK